MKNLLAALANFHQTMPTVLKDKLNPHFRSLYAGLDSILPAIKPHLQNAGLVFTQLPKGEHELTTLLCHVESGETLESTFSMKPTKDDPQGRASVITYMRRYALVAMLGLNTDNDDDGEGAIDQPNKSRSEKISITKQPEKMDDIPF